MFAPFSRGYYVGRMLVEPHDGEDALMQADQHACVNEQLYADGGGIARLDRPLVMKLAHRHFPVHADTGVPESTLFVPRWVLEGIHTKPLPAVLEVLLAKADTVPRVLRYSGLDDDVVAT